LKRIRRKRMNSPNWKMMIPNWKTMRIPNLMRTIQNLSYCSPSWRRRKTLKRS